MPAQACILAVALSAGWYSGSSFHSKDWQGEKQSLIVVNLHIQNTPSTTSYQLFKKQDSLQLIIYRKALFFRNYTCYTLLFSKHWHKMKAKNATWQKYFWPHVHGSFKLRSRLLTPYYCALAACGRSIIQLSYLQSWLGADLMCKGSSHLPGEDCGKDLAGSASWLECYPMFPGFKGLMLTSTTSTYSSLIATCARGWEKLWNPSILPVKTDKFS